MVKRYSFKLKKLLTSSLWRRDVGEERVRTNESIVMYQDVGRSGDLEELVRAVVDVDDDALVLKAAVEGPHGLVSDGPVKVKAIFKLLSA